MTQFAAIPTIYNGVQFRSRLEARWAAFFDLCGWQWEYEPFDLNGWIPDFLVRSPYAGVRPKLIEVKPLTETDGEQAPRDVTNKMESALGFPRQTPDRRSLEWDTFVSAMKYRVLIFGTKPSLVWVWNQDYKTWSLADRRESPPYPSPERDWVFAFNWFGTCHDALWKQAGNAVQWKGPRA